MAKKRAKKQEAKKIDDNTCFIVMDQSGEILMDGDTYDSPKDALDDIVDSSCGLHNFDDVVFICKVVPYKVVKRSLSMEDFEADKVD